MKEVKEENNQESRSIWGGMSSNGFSEVLGGEGREYARNGPCLFIRFHLLLTPKGGAGSFPSPTE